MVDTDPVENSPYTEVVLKLTGLHCGDCVASLEGALGRLPGVASITVTFPSGQTLLTLDLARTGLDRLAQVVHSLGYGIEGATLGLHATPPSSSPQLGTAWTALRRELYKCTGLFKARLDRRHGVVWLTYHPQLVNPQGLTSIFNYNGWQTRPLDPEGLPGHDHDHDHGHDHDHSHQGGGPLGGRSGETVLASLLLVLGLLAWFAGLRTSIAPLLFISATAIGGYRLFRAGLQGLAHSQLTIDLLVLLAVVGAFYLGLTGHFSAFGEAAGVVVLMSLGELLEERTLRRTRTALEGLSELTPTTARVLRRDRELELPLGQVVVGDVALVRSGERIPVDGLVTSGTAEVNQAPVTGESLPVTKHVGDEVVGGTFNEQGFLQVRTTRVGSDTTLARIKAMVEQAQSRKARVQRTVEAFARYYVPVVVALAFLTWVVGTPRGGGLEKALVLLVVACPCSLVISTPVAVVSALGHGARNGVLFKGGAYLERMGQLTLMAFDKTGTLTRGEIRVAEIVPLTTDEESLLALAAAAETGSEHHLARAIRRTASERGLTLAPATDFEPRTGLGIGATVGGRRVLIGSPSLFTSQGLALSSQALAAKAELEAKGHTVVLVACEGQLLGLLALADTLRANSATVVGRLRQMGLRPLLLSGDNGAATAAVAQATSISDYHGDLTPEGKLELLEGFKKEGVIAMVGDGINDAPALAAADVGIALGRGGTDVAVEAADVVLVGSDLERLPYALGLSRATLANIRLNLAFSFSVVGLAIALALAGAISMWMGVLLHEASALLVIFNGLRLGHYRSRRSLWMDYYQQLKAAFQGALAGLLGRSAPEPGEWRCEADHYHPEPAPDLVCACLCAACTPVSAAVA